MSAGERVSIRGLLRRSRMPRAFPSLLIILIVLAAASALMPWFSMTVSMCLLLLWFLSVIPPTSYFGVSVMVLVLGYGLDGCKGVFLLGFLNTLGLTCMISSADSLPVPRKGYFCFLVTSLAKLLRSISSFTISTMWTIPATLTLAPRLIFVIYFELVVMSSLAILKVFAGCNDGANEYSSKAVSQDANKLPVILVHGIGGCGSQWYLGKALLRAKCDSLDPVCVFNYSPSDSEGIDQIASTLSDYVNDICERSSCRKVALIGHSIGGLICSYYAENFAAASGVSVSMVLCIGTPWTGLAQFCGPQLVQEAMMCAGGFLGSKMRSDLETDSDVLKSLQSRQLATSPRSAYTSGGFETRYYNLAGRLDALVVPSRQIIDRKAFWCCWLPHVAHHSILMSETVWDQVAVWAKSLVREGRETAQSRGKESQCAPTAPSSLHEARVVCGMASVCQCGCRSGHGQAAHQQSMGSVEAGEHAARSV